MSFSVTILGSNSAIPAYGRHPSAQIVTYGDSRFLVDCGEGTQMRMIQHRARRSGLNRIFISHLHGDHYFGLIGLITSFSLLGRKNPLHLHSFPELKPIIDLQLEAANLKLQYELVWHFLSGEAEEIFATKSIQVRAIPLTHRIPCVGFLFTEQPKPRTYLPGKGQQHNVPFEAIESIKAGADFTGPSGEVVPNSELTGSPPPSLSYAYLTDTRPSEDPSGWLNGCDLLYHEATFMGDASEKAERTYHTTAAQAAQLAKKAKVKRLLLGHFSAKYQDLEALLEEAQAIFPNTALAIEGRTFEVGD